MAEPKPTLAQVVQLKDAGDTQARATKVADALEFLASQIRENTADPNMIHFLSGDGDLYVMVTESVLA